MSDNTEVPGRELAAPAPHETPMQTIASRRRGWSRFLAGALLLHLPLFAYPLLRLSAWFDLGVVAALLVFLPLFFGQVISRVYLRRATALPALLARRLFDLWLGISPVVVCLVLAFELPVALGFVEPGMAAFTIVASAAALTIVGFLTAIYPSLVLVELTSEKVADPLRFVQLSDVHIGSRSVSLLEQVVFRINELEPQFVCITGDFIDGPDVGETELRSLKSLNCPVYFSIGNHEKYEDLDRIQRCLEDLGVHVLRNRSLLAGPVQVIGVDDIDDALQVQRQLANIAIDRGKYVILLYHRPRGLEAAADAGVDLMLSGHTHGGQIVPFNLVVGRVFARLSGLFTHGATHLYVSTGAGTWGPIMRLGTRSEIALFEVRPKDTVP